MLFPPLYFFFNDVKHGDYIAKTAMEKRGKHRSEYIASGKMSQPLHFYISVCNRNQQNLELLRVGCQC